ncbi:MAG: proline--tRNA ligase, partial [Candidatus Eremiobacteraeota bacterium]|nr:proline--tRNA ligase [Candidatus Eremiobacteraeota bacterium]
FVDSDRAIKHVHTTSWGVSWRMLGGLIMVHGDDRGLRLPPKMAPLEAVLIPIVRSNDDRAIAVAQATAERLSSAGFRVRLDARDEQPGWKYSEWDLRGVPVRVEIGPRDVDAGTAVLVRRDRAKGDPEQRRGVGLDEVESVLRELLDDVQASLYREAKAFLDEHTFATSDRAEFFELCRTRAGMVDITWCNRAECEANVKAATTATSRILRPLDREAVCTACGEPAQVRAYFAQSY